MLTRIHIENFKRFEEVEFELGQSVVFIGPNNSGKTSALQALALWQAGMRSLPRPKMFDPGDESVIGVLNVKDMTFAPALDPRSLWKNNDSYESAPIKIQITGIKGDVEWRAGLEFLYVNSASIECSAERHGEESGKLGGAIPIPSEAADIKIALLPPMSGIISEEPELRPGRVDVLIGEGRTAEILRNVCLRIYEDDAQKWSALAGQMRRLFSVDLSPPVRDSSRGTIGMSYRESSGAEFDLVSAGRGFQQILLLLAHLYGNPGSVLLLDEPDAHLEVLRQREVYQLLTETARELGCQIIAASHSEVLMQEAAQRDMVIAFVGNRPHRVDDRGAQLVKSLREYGHEHYYLAELKGFVLYLEGATDLAILQSFADTLGHPAREVLADPYVHYVANDTAAVRRHFEALRAAKPDLVGFALFDRFEKDLHKSLGGMAVQWRRREIENYLCSRDVLLAYAAGSSATDLVAIGEAGRRRDVMAAVIDEMAGALRVLGKDPWSPDIKATDEFLDRLFDLYFQRLGLPNLMRKTNYHVLARLVRREDIDAEVIEKLDALVEAARQAKPRID